MPKPADEAAPLTPAVVHILLALVESPRHGYAIMKTVDEVGGPPMGPGTIYGTLQRLEASGLVRESPRRSDPRRRVFEITQAGEAALRAEADRITRLASLMRERSLTDDEAAR